MSPKQSHKQQLSLVLLFMVLMTPALTYLCTEAMYEDYLTHNNRNFNEEKKLPEYTQRFNTYCENREQIDQKNNQNLSYKLSIYWQWMDKTQQERKQLVKIELPVQQIVSSPNLVRSSEPRKVSAVPPSVDWRDSGDVSSIKNQGSCGCCWSFTTVGLYESWMMVKGEQQYDLSEQYLLECTTLFTKNVQRKNYTSTCNGGYVDFSGLLARINGIPQQSKFPYISGTYTGSTFPTTPGICQANQTIMYAANPNVTTFNLLQNNTADQMKILIAQAPVGALIYADTGFQAYDSGVYDGCPSDSASRINHAVVIIGYDSNGNYIVKNSWGTGWGTDGFGIVSKDADCGLSKYAFIYQSSASPGNGVLYYNQVNLGSQSNSGLYTKFLGALFLVIMALVY